MVLRDDYQASDFLNENSMPRDGKVELKVILLQSTGAIRLNRIASAETMYGKYWYRLKFITLVLFNSKKRIGVQIETTKPFLQNIKYYKLIFTY